MSLETQKECAEPLSDSTVRLGFSRMTLNASLLCDFSMLFEIAFEWLLALVTTHFARINNFSVDWNSNKKYLFRI